MRKLVVGVSLLVTVGCGGGGAGGPQTAAPRTVRGPADVIIEAEIRTSAYQNALEIVRNLRPRMLIPRGAGPDASGLGAASIPIVVYQDDVRLGEVSSLINIPADRVTEIRFINARDATTRYGTGHSSGVILVTTRR